jgi:hypothetical protein
MTLQEKKGVQRGHKGGRDGKCPPARAEAKEEEKNTTTRSKLSVVGRTK